MQVLTKCIRQRSPWLGLHANNVRRAVVVLLVGHAREAGSTAAQRAQVAACARAGRRQAHRQRIGLGGRAGGGRVEVRRDGKLDGRHALALLQVG